MKYRLTGESFEDCCFRISSTLSDNDEHRRALSDILLDMRFLPAGRVQAAIGAPLKVTPWNCFVSGTIADDFEDIMQKATEAGKTMRLGGGIGYDFSTLRPRGSNIKSLNSSSSGPVSFMSIFDSLCGTISSAGHRRGAQMGVLRVDHPDIEEFVCAKRNSHNLTRFNISVGVTDPFMKAVKEGTDFNLKFRGKVVKTIDARALWEMIMRSTWDFAEPGVLFIDRINKMNNLWYCEQLAATNPCGEQPLPPYGACLLGSFNMVKYITQTGFNSEQFKTDIKAVVQAMDNIIDIGIYPLPQQEEEGKSKRRMGLGVTGMANALEHMDFPYGGPKYIQAQDWILEMLRDTAYLASIDLAKEKGPFPLYDPRFLEGKFVKSLPKETQELLSRHGQRNSHILSIAPTGTISLAADNISSGIEPVFTHEYIRTIQTEEGVRHEEVTDYAFREWGVRGRTANELTVEEHVGVLTAAQRYVDSACSKTCNVGPDVSWDRFKGAYMLAYDGGAKGITTFRVTGKRMGILNAKEAETKEYIDDEDEVQVCKIDETTGQPTCS